jgi:DNA polymerase elongation subunit (family B)
MEKGNEEQAFLQDQLQYAVKILMNSFYGVFASSFYRFTDPKLGASITEWARYNIKNIIRQLDDEGKDVVYSDTDSIFVRSPVSERKEKPFSPAITIPPDALGTTVPTRSPTGQIFSSPVSGLSWMTL